MNEQQPFQMMQRLPSEFTQADALRLQQYNAGLATAKQKVDEGELSPEDGEVLSQTILHLRAPLLAAQEQQKALIRDMRVKELQEDSALAQGMAHRDAVYRANGLQERVAPFTNPRTGETAYLYESQPQKWEQIQFGGGEGQQEQQGQVQDYFPLTAQEVPNVSGALNPNFGPQQPGTPPPAPPGAPDSPSPGAPPGAPDGGVAQPTLRPNPQGGHTLEIWNGANRQLAHFDGSGRIVGQEFFDPNGQPIQQGQQQGQQGELEDEQISPAQERAWLVEAEKQFPPVDPSMYPQTPQGQLAYISDVQRRQRDVLGTAASWKRSYLVDRRQKRGAMLIQQNQMRHEKAIEEQKLKDAQEKDKAAAEKERKAEEKKYRDTFQSRLEKHVDELGKDERWKGKTHAERVAEAKARLKEEGYAEPGKPDQAAEASPEQQAKTKAQAEAMQKLHAMTAGFGGTPEPVPSTAKPSPGATQTGPNTEKVPVPAGGHLLGLGEQKLGSDNPSAVAPERIKQLRQVVEARQSRAYFGHFLTREGASLNALSKLLQKADAAGKMTEADKGKYKKLLEDLGRLDVRGELDLE